MPYDPVPRSTCRRARAAAALSLSLNAGLAFLRTQAMYLRTYAFTGLFSAGKSSRCEIADLIVISLLIAGKAVNRRMEEKVIRTIVAGPFRILGIN